MNSQFSSSSLYVHIPFCNSKCKYCDFFSVTNKQEMIPQVISEIIRELKYKYLYYNKPDIKTIFIGGGTPSIIPIEYLKQLLEEIKFIAPNYIEWSIESNPESVTKEFLQICDQIGVNRLSVGIQSINNNVLDVLGRNAKREQILNALNLIKTYWNKSLNFDLISSIYKQTESDIAKDIEFLLRYKPDHISFYSLSIEEGTVYEKEILNGQIEELDQDISEKLWFLGRQILKNAGYNQYEVSNFSKNKPCIHNINYWELKPYIGVGPSAVSTVINNNGKIIRVYNPKSISKYLKGEKTNWGADIESIDNIEFLKDYLIMGLRLKNGINKDRFKKIFNKEIEEVISQTKEFKSQGLVITSSSNYMLTEKGFNIMNSILVDILKDIDSVIVENLTWFY